MTAIDETQPPVEFGERGLRLWGCLIDQDRSLSEETNPNRETAITACRTADRLESLEQQAKTTDIIYLGARGPITHPVHIECRQVAALLPRLIAALRLPDDATGKRPQRRPIRGVHQPHAVSASVVERLRAG